MHVSRRLILILRLSQSGAWSPLTAVEAAETLGLLPYLNCKHAQVQIQAVQPLFQAIISIDTETGTGVKHEY